MSISSKTLRGCLRAWLILFAFLAFSHLSFDLADQRYIQDVGADVPSILPVLVIASGRAQIVPWCELDDFIQEHPDYSFLVPKEQETLYGEQIIQSHRERGIDAYPEFKVQQLAQGRQYLEVGSYGDGAVVGWYEATDKQVFPHRYKAYGPGFAFIVMALAVILAGATAGLAIIILMIHKWLRRSGLIPS